MPSLRLVLAALVAPALAGSVGKISPELDPESSKKFFNKDYPSDSRPVADKKYFDFKHPYPIVQENNAFDKDYVKDENGDNGEWKAQMTYDVLRTKIRKMGDIVNEAKKVEQNEKADLDDAKAKEAEAEAASKKAEAAHAKAQKKVDEADAEVKRLAGTGNESSADGEIGKAVEHVEEEMAALEKCKKELEEAKAKLKEAMELKEKLEKEHAAAVEKAEEKKRKKKERKEKKVKEVEEEVDHSQDTAEELKEEMEMEKKEHEKAHKEAEKENHEASQTEADLKKAAENLRKYRGSRGHHEAKKSDAARHPTVLLTVLLTAATMRFAVL